MMRIATSEAKATVIYMNKQKSRNQNCQTKMIKKMKNNNDWNDLPRKNSPATCRKQGHYHLARDDNMQTQNLLKSQPHKNMSNPIAHLGNFGHKLNYQSYNSQQQ
jgi:hypothetical protein